MMSDIVKLAGLITGEGGWDFSGKTVLVTGSTQNLGFTIAAAFARCGAHVVLHGREKGELREAVARLREECTEAQVSEVLFDLADGGETDMALRAMEVEGRRPDILINNAAALGVGESGFLEQSEEFFTHVMEVNVLGVFRCSQWAARLMKERGRGVILNISSLAGERAVFARSAYNTSKAAIDGLTRSMAVELAAYGIRVNAIAPGYIWTPRWDAIAEGVEERRRLNIPFGQATAQAEIARLALFLASDAVPSLIGASLVIDGGLNAQQVPADTSV
jgi:NAD(P)-dependent dehydrogenase (short-subunit alcohol dehydrogenase family)